MILLLLISLSWGITQATGEAPVINRHQGLATGTIVNYVGIPGGPVIYSELGPGGVKSVTSVNAGNPVVYSNVGPGGITSVSYVGAGGPVVYNNLGPGGIKSVSSINPGGPVLVSISGPGT